MTEGRRFTARRIWIAVALLVIAAGVVVWLVRPRPVAVQLATVVRQSLQSRVFTSGSVRSLQRQVVMPTDLTGPVQKIDVAAGAHVHAGEALITLQNAAQVAALQAAQSTVTNSQQALQSAQQQYNAAPPLAQPQLLATVITARNALVEARAELVQARSAYEATLISAQFAGTVLFVYPQGIAPDGTSGPILEVVSDAKQAVVDVSQEDAVQIHPGMTGIISSDAYAGKQWTGAVAQVADFAATSATGAQEVEVDFSVPASFPVPVGYSVNVNIISATRHQVPVLPYDSLVQQGSSYAVFIYRGGHVYEQPVSLGITGTAKVEVAKGVEPGEQIVQNPPSTLASGQAVTIR